jgi:hypothetical protein
MREELTLERRQLKGEKGKRIRWMIQKKKNGMAGVWLQLPY